jgi:hypothetical protein
MSGSTWRRRGGESPEEGCYAQMGEGEIWLAELGASFAELFGEL